MKLKTDDLVSLVKINERVFWSLLNRYFSALFTIVAAGSRNSTEGVKVRNCMQ